MESDLEKKAFTTEKWKKQSRRENRFGMRLQRAKHHGWRGSSQHRGMRTKRGYLNSQKAFVGCSYQQASVWQILLVFSQDNMQVKQYLSFSLRQKWASWHRREGRAAQNLSSVLQVLPKLPYSQEIRSSQNFCSQQLQYVMLLPCNALLGGLCGAEPCLGQGGFHVPSHSCNLCASAHLWLRLQSPESPASCPSGSCFCPAAVAVLAQAGLLEAPVLAGYFQGPQAPCPTGISSYRWSAFGVHGSSPLGTDVPCIFGSQYCKQDGSCTVDWEVQLSTHMVEFIAKHLVEFSHEFLEFFFPKKDLMPVIFQYVVWNFFF